jgi:hypothetical protein
MLPSTELLASRLREISSLDGRLHTLPAWLGYGTLILKERASSFLKAFLSMEEDPRSIQMADNYYSILSNSKPELWFGQQIDLGLGQPFTVGTAGDDRNWYYIVGACYRIISKSGFTSSRRPPSLSWKEPWTLPIPCSRALLIREFTPVSRPFGRHRVQDRYA